MSNRSGALGGIRNPEQEGFGAELTGMTVLPVRRSGVFWIRAAPVLCRDGKRGGVVCPGVHCVLHASVSGPLHLSDLFRSSRQGTCASRVGAPDAPVGTGRRLRCLGMLAVPIPFLHLLRLDASKAPGGAREPLAAPGAGVPLAAPGAGD